MNGAATSAKPMKARAQSTLACRWLPGAFRSLSRTCADSIARQNGGWSLTWQGTGTTNAQFPNAESIFSGIRAAVSAGGGKATLSGNGE